MDYQKDFSKKMQDYFSTLPKLVQESMIQSGVKFTSEKELRDFVAQLEHASDQ